MPTDHIFTNELTNDVCSGLLMTDVSDHLPVFAFESFSSALVNCNWDFIIQPENINTAYNDFANTFTDLYNTHCPIKKVHTKNNNIHRGKVHKYKNKLTNILRNAEKDHHSTLLQKHQHDIKGTWKVFNSLIKIN